MTQATKTTAPETKSANTEVIAQVDQIKDQLKNVIRDLTTVGDLLKTAEKEKKASFKEVESVRATLRSLQRWRSENWFGRRVSARRPSPTH